MLKPMSSPLITYSPETPGGHQDTVLLHPTAPRWLVLNDSALHIAEDLLREQSPDPTIDRLVDEYGISRHMARKDVMSVLDHLKQEGFWGEQVRQPMIRTPELRSLFL